jgi:hypothetical protein
VVSQRSFANIFSQILHKRGFLIHLAKMTDGLMLGALPVSFYFWNKVSGMKRISQKGR